MDLWKWFKQIYIWAFKSQSILFIYLREYNIFFW